MVKKNSRRTVGDRVDNLIETVAANHLEAMTAITELKTALKDVPARVTALEASQNQSSGGWLTFDKLFTGACALFTAIVAYLGFRH